MLVFIILLKIEITNDSTLNYIHLINIILHFIENTILWLDWGYHFLDNNSYISYPTMKI